MWAYVLRRILYAIPILICVNLITFILFFFVNSPDDVAYTVVGEKHTKPEAIYNWKREHFYHYPRLLNTRDTVFYFSRNTEVPKDISETLDDYSIRLYGLDKATVDSEVNELKKERDTLPKQKQGDEPGYLDGFKVLIDKAGKDFSGNEIILVDIPDMTMEESLILTGLLDKAVPFIIIERPGSVIPDKIRTISVIRFSNLGNKDNKKQLNELAEFIDAKQASGLGFLTQTLFYKKSVNLFLFDFGKSDREGIDISSEVVSRMGPSLMITVPAFFLSLFLNIFIAMIVAYTRGTYIDKGMALICILIMSVLSLFYYFSVQLVFGTWLKIFPVSGFAPGFSGIRFVLLPIFVTVFMGIGGGVRFYRTIFLEEVNRDYTRTARSKGLSELSILFKHVLKNAMIPILTNVVMVIPTLFLGSLILESFFGIPGLGGYTLEGIQAQDFRVVGSMVYLGAFLYILSLIMTDISYTFVDPRVRLK